MRRVACVIYDAKLSANSLDLHRQKQLGVYQSRVIDQCIIEERHPPVVYRAVQAADRQYFCPVPGCPGSAMRPWNMRLHFSYRDPYDRVYIPKDGMCPRCRKCHVQTNALITRHEQSQICRTERARWLQHEAAPDAVITKTLTFCAYKGEFEARGGFKIPREAVVVQ